MTERSPLESLTPEEVTLEERATIALDALSRAGWEFAGSGPNINIGTPGEMGLTVVLPREAGELNVEDLTDLLSENGEVVPGWTVLSDQEPESGGLVGADYSGQIDGLERGVTALAAALDPAAFTE